MCIEQLQISAQAHVDAARLWSSETLSTARLETELRQACRQLDEVPFTRITKLFHMVFRTTKEGKTGGLNPFRDPDAISEEAGLEQAVVVIIGTIQDLVRENGMVHRACVRICLLTGVGAQLQELSKPPNLEEGSEEFARKNMGRLTSKFLLSFTHGIV